MRLQLLLVLSAFGPSLCARVANVTNGQELQYKLNNGTQHVLVINHLSMLGVAPQLCGSNEWLLCVSSDSHGAASEELISIWGRCPNNAYLAPLPTGYVLPVLKDEQCVVRVAWGWLGVAGKEVWVHNLHVVLAAAPAQRGDGQYSNLIDIWCVEEVGPAHLWFTAGGLQGDRSTGHLLDVWSSDSFVGKAYVSDSFMGDTRLAQYSGVTSVGDTFIKNTVIQGIERENVTDTSTAVVFIKEHAVLCVNCTNNATVDMFVTEPGAASGDVYADEVAHRIMPNGTQPLPVAQAPLDRFLNDSDPKILAAQTRRAEVEVATGAQLQDAVSRGTMHVHVVEHLNMDQLQNRACGSTSSLLCVDDESHTEQGVFSIRGTCARNTLNDERIADVTLPTLKPSQCVIVTPASWLTVSGRATWIHNVHVVLQRRFQANDVSDVRLVQLGSGAAVECRAWLTAVGLQGNSDAKTYLLHVHSTSGLPARVLFSAGFLGDTRHHKHPGILSQGFTAVEHTVLQRLVSTGANTKGALLADGLDVLSVNNTLESNTFLDGTVANFQSKDGGKVYSDEEATVWEVGTDRATSTLSVESAPAAAFPTLQDPRLQDLQVQLGVPPSTPGLQPPSTSPPPLPAPASDTKSRAGLIIAMSAAIAIILLIIAIAMYFCWKAQAAAARISRHPSGASWAGSAAQQPSPAFAKRTSSNAFKPSTPSTSAAPSTPSMSAAPDYFSPIPAPPAQPLVQQGTAAVRPVSRTRTRTHTATFGTMSVVHMMSVGPPPPNLLPLNGAAPPEVAMQRVVDVLEALYRQQVLLFDRFKLPSVEESERRRGGQAFVQFVEDTEQPQPLAVKFFMMERDFRQELAVYREPALREAMPAVVMSVEASAWTPAGWDTADAPLPPCLVMERGKSMLEYATGSGHNLFTTIQALGHVVEKLDALHKAGWVHRDLKPGNLLWNENSHTWSLLDFGCAARSGTVARLVYSLYYTAPEVFVAEADGRRDLVVTPALDIWSIGVVAFEMLTEERVFPPFSSLGSVKDCALGRAPYPWEDTERCEPLLQKLRRFRSAVLACLQRDPRQRVDCAVLYKMLVSLFDSDYTLTPNSAPAADEAPRDGTSARLAEIGASHE